MWRNRRVLPEVHAIAVAAFARGAGDG
jgi:hypothetical protein